MWEIYQDLDEEVRMHLEVGSVATLPSINLSSERASVVDDRVVLAFLGVEKHSIVSIGSYGVVKTRDEKMHFRAGLEAMLQWLEPEIVLVYGSTPDDVFGEYWKYSEFIKYPDWTSYQRRDEEQAQSEEKLRKPGRKG